MPGKQGQMDWGFFEDHTVYEDGQWKKLYCFLMILGYSRTRYIEFVTDMSTSTLIRCHQNAFRYFGGYPEEILYDNMKQVGNPAITVGIKPIGEFKAVVGLNALNGIGELFRYMPKEDGGGIGAVFLKSLQITESAVLVNECVLIELLPSGIPYKTDCRDKLHIDLAALAGILHLFIGLWGVFWIGKRCGHLPTFPQKSIQAGDGSGIAAQTELDPKHHQSGIWIPAAHI